MGWLMGRKNKFEAFWDWFMDNEQSYFELNEAKREQDMNQLYKRLQKLNKHFAYEFSHELIDGKREFIISAEGMTEAFDDVLQLFDAAPELERFVVIPFRQPSDEEFAVTYGDIEVTWDDVFFVDNSGDLDLTIYAKDFKDANKEEYIPAIFILLDNVIGEFNVGTRIGEIVFENYENQPEARPIAELRDVIEESAQENLDLNFLPSTFKKLKKFDESLQEEGLSLDEGLGLRWADRSMAYDQTPYDVLPFADIGMDGVHFGLLTDFGKIKDLEEAFIVCVNPMDPDHSVELVARNPKEFVDLLYTVKDGAAIANLTYIETQEEYTSFSLDLNKAGKENPELFELQRQTAEKMKGYMDCARVEDVYMYLKKTITATREKMVVLPTRDKLGIVSIHPSSRDLPLYPVSEESDISIEGTRTFFATAPVESKLAFIRDVQHMGLIDNETPLKGLIVNELEKMGFGAEVERLKSLDW